MGLPALLGRLLLRRKAANLHPVDNRGGWWGIIREPYTGAWQRNVEVRIDTVLTVPTVYRCIALIAGDVAKMRVKLVAQDGNGIWTEVAAPAFSPVLRKPNSYQNRIQFFETWMNSKLIHGNTYVLKHRDARGVVIGLYVLDPNRVTPLVAPDGSVFYQLKRDDLSGVGDDVVTVPAREIIHDRMNCLYHPLVGVSPIYAAGLAAVQAVKIQTNPALFFGAGANPSGILKAPGQIADATATRLKEYWEANYSGTNVGKVAVLGDGLKYEAMTMKATDAQLIEQLKWTAETICSVFGVPAYMAGVGAAPLNNNVEALTQQYYAQCLQVHIESIEVCLDEGLGLTAAGYGSEFDLGDLMRMDTATKVKAAADAIGAGFMSPNEARAMFDMKPVEGGGTPYLQQQNFSLSALNKRDQQADPFGSAGSAQPEAMADEPAAGGATADEQAAADERALGDFRRRLRKGLAHAA